LSKLKTIKHPSPKKIKVGCTKAILENNGIENKNYLVLTDLDIEKNKNFDLDADELDKVKTKIKQILA
jgi:uncharacterized metal-binding protein